MIEGTYILNNSGSPVIGGTYILNNSGSPVIGGIYRYNILFHIILSTIIPNSYKVDEVQLYVLFYYLFFLQSISRYIWHILRETTKVRPTQIGQILILRILIKYG